jgi:hypothetical protein
MRSIRKEGGRTIELSGLPRSLKWLDNWQKHGHRAQWHTERQAVNKPITAPSNHHYVDGMRDGARAAREAAIGITRTTSAAVGTIIVAAAVAQNPTGGQT